ncbi:phosphatase PAP2 family protein [Alteribacter aurantiacus]|uniref:phosphatase PAP2 family protein n=1 Tax=Alteribacter aurantiacus TaxID=254410 RepID=UPI000424D579|nr:phosphatase PAP2 family protein [Alteribacter aurantiacus]
MNQKQRRTIFFLVLVALFLFLFTQVARAGTADVFRGMDMLIMQLVQGVHHDEVTPLVLAITSLGGIPALTTTVVLSMVLFLFLKRSVTALFYGAAVALGGGLNWFLKWVFQRERPDFDPIIIEQGYSFPSGHAMGSIITYGLLTYFIVKILPSKGAKAGVIAASTTLILFIGLSRVYLGVHYFSDIIAGFLTGGLWIAISVFVWKRVVKEGLNEKRTT